MRPYTPQEFQAKAQIDIALFSELFSNYLTESDVPAFTQMLIKAYDLWTEIFEEGIASIDWIFCSHLKEILSKIPE